jgi:hypothetical protein
MNVNQDAVKNNLESGGRNRKVEWSGVELSGVEWSRAEEWMDGGREQKNGAKWSRRGSRYMEGAEEEWRSSSGPLFRLLKAA